MRKALLLVVVALIGCYSDPMDPKTWIKKLDDVREQKEAVRQLVRLKDKQAVEPLMNLYRRSHDREHLKAIASFADPRSVPLLIEALDYTEDSFDGASIAATALGEIGDKQAVAPLMKVLDKQLPIKSRANVVKVEAMRALAKIKDPRGVDALIKVLLTPADDQDFYLNKIAAKALGEFADPRAVPALIRGMFMVGRGADIFQDCRLSLIRIGEPAVEPLIQAMQRKNVDLEADGKKYMFFAGIIEQKTSMLLGDMRSKKAIPALLEELGKKDEGLAASTSGGRGVSSHQSVIISLGQIGDPSVIKPLTDILVDAKRHQKERSAAAEALNLIGDPAALTPLAALIKTKFISGNVVDPDAATLVGSAITAYTRLTDAEHADIVLPKVDPELADMHELLGAADDRLAVVKECKKDMACYAKYVGDKNYNKAEKAAFMLARMGKPALPVLLKQLGNTNGNGVVRMAVLFGIGQLGDKTCGDCRTALDAQILLDAKKPQPWRHLADEMSVLREIIGR